MTYTRWFKYDRDYLCVNKSQFVPVIFEPPCIIHIRISGCKTNSLTRSMVVREMINCVSKNAVSLLFRLLLSQYDKLCSDAR